MNEPWNRHNMSWRGRVRMDGGGSPSGTTQVVQNSDPWSGQQAALKTGYNAALENILNRPRSFYPNSTVTPFSNQTNAALGNIEARATGAQPILNAAQTEAQKTLSGDYLASGNPNLAAMIQRVSNAITPQIDSKFAAAGRYGSGAHADAVASALADAGTGLAYQDYQNERGNMLKTQVLAPQIADAAYGPDRILASVGAAREAQGGKELADDIARYDFSQNEPAQRTQQFIQAITAGGVIPGTTSTTQPYFSTPAWQQALGAGATTAGIAGTLFGQNGVFPGGSGAGWMNPSTWF